MKKILYLLTLPILLTMLGCGTEAAAPAKETIASDPVIASSPIAKSNPSTVDEKKWVAVKSWSGNGVKTTEKFTITGSDWRVNWKTNGMNGNDSVFILTPHKGDSTLAPLVTALRSASNVSYVHEGAGTYYISVIASNINWNISVEEQK